MPLYDFRCNKCKHEFEETLAYHQLTSEGPPECPECGSYFTKRVWLKAPNSDKAKDPYDYLDGPIPDSKTIKSFANDKRKGGKDTT